MGRSNTFPIVKNPKFPNPKSQKKSIQDPKSQFPSLKYQKFNFANFSKNPQNSEGRVRGIGWWARTRKRLEDKNKKHFCLDLPTKFQKLHTKFSKKFSKFFWESSKFMKKFTKISERLFSKISEMFPNLLTKFQIFQEGGC